MKNIFKKLFSENVQDDARETDISDFFKVDIYDLFKYQPKYDHSEKSIINGNEAKCYSLRLKELELGLFYEIEIIIVGENECNITIKGRSNEMTSYLERFISFCANEYGLDRSGYGAVEGSEYEKIRARRNVFSRMWDRVWVSNMTESKNMEITIFGVTKIKSDKI